MLKRELVGAQLCLRKNVLSLKHPAGVFVASANANLSGRGPSISFKLLPYGSVVVDVANEFTSAGINQTLHRIVLTVSAGLSIVLPLSSVNATVQSGVVVAETIIVGGVPERYATYGAGGTLAQTDALLMMEED